MLARYAIVLLLATVLFTTYATSAYSITSQESKDKIKQSIQSLGISGNWTGAIDKVDEVVRNNWTSIDGFSISVKTNTSELNDFSISQYGNASWAPIVINGTVVGGIVPPVHQCETGHHWNETQQQCVPDITPPKPVEICGDGIDNDGDGLVDEGCPIIPPSPDKPTVDVNTTKTERICVVGDIDDNSGLTTQVNLAKKYNCDAFVVPGDYNYKNGQHVLTVIDGADFNHVVIVCGNHDSCAAVQAYMKMNKTYGQFDIDPKIAFYLIDGNTGIDCSSAQYTQIKDQLSSSDAWYNIPVIHQPFVTVKNNHHGVNGQFQCWDPLFRGNGVDIVLQAHVHNYQRTVVNGINYGVFGTGTHDTGSGMYSCDSDNWNGFASKCITGVNGITILDLQIDNPNVRHMDGWFLDNSGNVKDKFN